MSAPVFDLVSSPLTGRNLVEASAGTGKTFTLAALFVRLVLEARLTVEQILVVTFTEAATEELRGRIRDRLREASAAYHQGASDDPFLSALLGQVPSTEETREALLDALRCFDEAPIFTIHGFCQRVLQERAFECSSPFDTELLADESPLLREVVTDFWRREAYGASPAFVHYLAQKKVTPASLARFLRTKARAPGLQTLAQPVGSDLEAAAEACRAAHRALQRAWPDAREPVARILAESPALNRATYPPRSVPGWLEEGGRWLDGGDPLAPCGALPKLCARTVAGAVKKGHEPPRHPFFDACGELSDRLTDLRAACEGQLQALKVRLIQYARSELPRRKAERNVRCFDDLLREVAEALTGPCGAPLVSALRDRYRAALIDEFQDTDPLQYTIFRTLYPDDASRLFLIGDPKQAIYGFRGADVFAYMDAAQRVGRRYTLGTNYRSGPGLVRAVNALFENAPAPFVFREIPFQPVTAASRDDAETLLVDGQEDRSPLQLWFAGRSSEKVISKAEAARTLPAVVASEIVRLLRAGAAGQLRIGKKPVEPGDLAVLVRTNRQATQVQDALRRRGVPSVVYSSESLFASREAEEWLRVLAAAAEPGSDRRVRAALATGLLGLDAAEIDRLAEDDSSWDRWLERFARYRTLWVERGFAAMARTLLAEERVRQRLLPCPTGERRLTNILHCLEALQRASVEGRYGPEGLVKWLGRQIEEADEQGEEQIRLETDEKAVKVVTVHKSKGLEYPITFCPFGWAGSRYSPGEEVVCHDPEDNLRVLLDLGSPSRDEHLRLAEKEMLAENLRLLYVALTRAKLRTYVVWGAYRDAETSALAYLLHPAPHDGAAPGADVVDRLAGHVSSLSDEALRADLAALAARASPRVEVRDLPAPADERFEAAFTPEAPIACRIFGGQIPSDEGLLSYSSIVSGREEAAELPDRDEAARASPASERPGAAPTIFDFPRGARAGTCLHAVMEEIDYAGAEPRAVEQVAAAKLELFGFDRSWAGAVSDMVWRVLAAPLDDAAPGFTLGRLSKADRVHEMEFYLPAGLLTPRALREAFRTGAGGHAGGLRRSLDELEFRPARGFLKGFVDLVFQAGGRYHLADWKSNFLGPGIERYGPEDLRRAMDEHLYGLQYHLYAAALHRHLASRLPGYDYGLHFGNIYYFFLRGVDPEAGIHFGVFRAQPDRAVVEALADRIARGAS